MLRAEVTVGSPGRGGVIDRRRRSVLLVVGVTVFFCLAGARGAEAAVVLIPGLHATSAGVTPDTGCEGAGSMAVLCAHLRADGRRVYAISSSYGQRNGAVLDSNGAISDNSDRLVAFVRNVVKPAERGAPILVGHSMGGLIARHAVARDARTASMLVSIGTPYDGSFWADEVVKGRRPRCIALNCLLVRAGVANLLQRSPAVRDMTKDARRAATGRMRPWPFDKPWAVIAGTIVGHPLGGCGYRIPSDLVVGCSSQIGLGERGRPTAGGHQSCARSCTVRLLPVAHGERLAGVPIPFANAHTDSRVLEAVEEAVRLAPGS